jgi:hypothetical protein
MNNSCWTEDSGWTVINMLNICFTYICRELWMNNSCWTEDSGWTVMNILNICYILCMGQARSQIFSMAVVTQWKSKSYIYWDCSVDRPSAEWCSVVIAHRRHVRNQVLLAFWIWFNLQHTPTSSHSINRTRVPQAFAHPRVLRMISVWPRLI